MQWSLEDIYKKQVRGKIPPRRHLRVLGEMFATGAQAKQSEFDFVNTLKHGSREEIFTAAAYVSPEEIKQLEAEKKIDKTLADEILKNKKHCKEKHPEGGVAYINCLAAPVGKVKTHRIDDLLTDFLQQKGWAEVSAPKYASELVRLITNGVFGEALLDLDVDEFYNFVTGAGTPDFKPTGADGNFFTDLQKAVKKIDINDQLFASKLMQHTSQDASIRGVGMGELALTIFFDNLRASAGKGDLSIDDSEFEIKGHGAALGPTGDTISGPAGSQNLANLIGKPLTSGGLGIGSEVVMSKSGKSKLGTFPKRPDGELYKKASDFAQAIADAYKVAKKLGKDKEFSKNLLNIILTNHGKDEKVDIDNVKKVYNLIDLTSADAINSGIALMNFVRYTSKEDVGHFMAHDFGASKGKNEKRPPSDPANLGHYVYVSGTPFEMAKKLSQVGPKVGFEKIKLTDLRPRIGLPTHSTNPYHATPVPL